MLRFSAVFNVFLFIHLAWLQVNASIQFDDIILIKPDIGIVLDGLQYRIWDVNKQTISESNEPLFDFQTPIDFIWIPYVKHPDTTKRYFELDFGKVCVRTNDENVLFLFDYNGSSNLLSVKRIPSSHCNQYIITKNDSTCSFTILPNIQTDLNLFNLHKSIFLVGHDRYSYIILDRKSEYIDMNRLVIITYRFNSGTNQTILSEPFCLKSLKKFMKIRMKTFVNRMLTNVKTIVPMANGDIYIFFDTQYCLTNINQYLNCNKSDLSEIFQLQTESIMWRSEIESNQSHTPEEVGTHQLYIQDMGLNELRATISLWILAVISFGIIILYNIYWCSIELSKVEIEEIRAETAKAIVATNVESFVSTSTPTTGPS